MKRDAQRELVIARKAEGLERKVSKLGRLAARLQSQRDKSHFAASRYLLALTDIIEYAENAEVECDGMAAMRRRAQEGIRQAAADTMSEEQS